MNLINVHTIDGTSFKYATLRLNLTNVNNGEYKVCDSSIIIIQTSNSIEIKCAGRDDLGNILARVICTYVLTFTSSQIQGSTTFICPYKSTRIIIVGGFKSRSGSLHCANSHSLQRVAECCRTNGVVRQNIAKGQCCNRTTFEGISLNCILIIIKFVVVDVVESK